MRTIAVTFAGRKIFMEILFPYIKKYEKYIDEYHIYAATHKQEDIDYIEDFASKNNFVKVFRADERKDPTYLWDECYKNSQDADAVYIKLDDDIVFMEESLFTDFVEFRKNNPQYPIIYPLIVNNTYISWIIQDKMGFKFKGGTTNFNNRWNSVVHLIETHLKTKGMPKKIGDVIPEEFILCPVGWGSADFAKSVHDTFLGLLEGGNENEFKKASDNSEGLVLSNTPPASINCCSWLGSGMKKYTEDLGDVWHDELWLSVYLPILTGKPNYVYFNSIVAHYSYYKQMENGILESDILERYTKIKNGM
jgi:hypothetical protein